MKLSYVPRVFRSSALFQIEYCHELTLIWKNVSDKYWHKTLIKSPKKDSSGHKYFFPAADIHYDVSLYKKTYAAANIVSATFLFGSGVNKC
jgi:hypothetical protein